MKKIIFIIILVVTCFSCGDTLYTMYIDNQTSDSIQIVFLGKSPYIMITPDSLYFPPMQKRLLYGASGRASKDGCGYTGIKEEEIKISTFSGKKLRKEIWNVKNWDCNGSFKQGWEMNFVITENDLE